MTSGRPVALEQGTFVYQPKTLLFTLQPRLSPRRAPFSSD